MFLKIPKNSQENTFARVSVFIKLRFEAWTPFLKNTFFIEHLWWQLLSVASTITDPLTGPYHRVWIHSETRAWHDKKKQSNATNRKVLTTQLNHLNSLPKWLSVRLWIKWFWVRVQLQSLRNIKAYYFLKHAVFYTTLFLVIVTFQT